MTESINDIASKHLGRTADGGTMTPYVTPDKSDPNLLVSIPRHLNRTAYGIDEGDLPFYGVDIWNCYEVSFLDRERYEYPFSGVLKFVVPADSLYIVESKSVKLYLNSYNMESLSRYEFKERVRRDLSVATASKVQVYLFDSRVVPSNVTAIDIITNGEQLSLNTSGKEYSLDKEDPSLLEVKPCYPNRMVNHLDSLRSNCRVTNQPDWGDLVVITTGKQCLDEDALAAYIASFRKENHFHEEVCEMIYKRIYDRFVREDVQELTIACFYTRRGGIDINPIRTLTPYTPGVSKLIGDSPWPKTARQ